MKAVRYHRHGGPDVLTYDEVERPKPGPRDVVIQVKAASVNHLDIWLRKGLPGITIRLPRVPGADAAGIVADVGAEVAGFKAGDRVLVDPGKCCWRCEFCGGDNNSMCAKYSIIGEHEDGCYAEFVSIPETNVIAVPDGVGFDVAAAAPLVYLTAWRMLMTRGRLQAGETVLILGAGAGVGTACIQIAKLAGARVIAACGSDEKRARALKLGADEAVEYGKKGLDVDMVVDYVGKETWKWSLRSLRRGGRLVTCGATTGYDPVEDIRHIFYRQLEVIGSTMGSRRELLTVLKLVFEGRLKPVIDRTLPLKAAAEAHRLIEGRKVFGKLLLQP